ncbi:hypothetical protein [Acinetobacter sp. Ver3]|uniref:putative pilus system protein FilF n=1 Tax=Acinetobacter sp. Ver3 TaxID=466088 RepID=UPI00044B6C34|nr:hypothetical protein [Acinetobacter sp. Ver3]EZQ01771.1 hypothetical protein CL42_12625 [Acinetobacter sp. Ver3]
MKKSNIIPFTFSTLFLALTGCGGESAKINEDPNRGSVTTSNGCLTSNDANCLGFVLDYPVEGLKFDCSTDKLNHYRTELDPNVAIGSCKVGDKVTFYIQGEASARKIELGTVDLGSIVPKKMSDVYIQIGVQDMAQGLTGKPIENFNMSDPTYNAMVGIIRILQTLGVDQISNVPGDIQQVVLSKDNLDGLQVISQNITANEFKNGSYVQILKPWLDVDKVSIDDAEKVAQQIIRMRSVGIYQANHLLFIGQNTNFAGFHGSSLNNNQAIADMSVITTREGYTSGYLSQWRGKPIVTGSNTSEELARVLLINQVPPEKLDVVSNSKDWLNNISQKIQKPLVFKSIESSNDKLEIYKGTLFGQSIIPGNQYAYQGFLGSKDTPTSTEVYGEWRQDVNSERYTGKLDILKYSPVSYLDRKVFKTRKNVEAGDQIIFPLYADLVFNFNDKTIPSQTVSIVIDENGDIRTNRTASSLQSTTCPSIKNTSTMTDELDVQQFIVGTTGTTYSTANDKSLTIRMILANPIFGNLNGVRAGLNNRPDFGVDSNSELVSSGGVRLNLQNLIVNNDIRAGINITSWDTKGSTAAAEWVNTHATYQHTYNSIPENKPTTEQLNLAKLRTGTIEIALTPCYQIGRKA